MFESFSLKEFQNSVTGNQMADLVNEIIGQYAGFMILERSTVLAFAATGALRVPGEALTAIDNLATILWQKRVLQKQ
jgi:hypothetical protein